MAHEENQVVPDANQTNQPDYSGPNYDIKVPHDFHTEGLQIYQNPRTSTDPFNLVNVDLADKVSVDALAAEYPDAWAFYYKDGSSYDYYQKSNGQYVLDLQGNKIPAPALLVTAVNFYLFITNPSSSNAGWNDISETPDYTPNLVERSTQPFSDYLTEYGAPPINLPYQEVNRVNDPNSPDYGKRVDALGNIIPEDYYIVNTPDSARVVGDVVANSPLANVVSTQYKALQEFQVSLQAPATPYEYGGAYSIGTTFVTNGNPNRVD